MQKIMEEATECGGGASAVDCECCADSKKGQIHLFMIIIMAYHSFCRDLNDSQYISSIR